ncbi:Stress response protein SCP2 [Streptomyces sp. DvalAA-14]|uniref:TerD family protein n=1 Tax=unclassified Streptomyces TaxID=2593676 RepID=UPI00081AFEB5|nr:MULTISPECIES: TerD family protein [unclassified Streptomyces]MYS25103.1 TerD family protein [Streptomyces sp. SID4948]SCE52167.1 Stress response protein SCP2 [Streptomyces sp. DvalAA-14]
MTHVMVKGSNIPLDAPGVRAVLRWSPRPGAPDVDASVLLVGADGRVRSDADFVFYNEPRHPSGLARHLPKKLAAEELTDTVEVDLAALDATVDRVVVAASCDGGPFSQVHDLALLLYDAAGPQHAAPLVTFDVVPDTGQETALICGELYRKNAGWKFRALGLGYADGLVGLATEFGIAVDDGESDPSATAAAPPTAAQPTSQPTPAPTAPATAAPTTSGPRPPAPAPAQPAAGTAYGYPLPAPAPAHVPAQPAYGYPQPAAAATAPLPAPAPTAVSAVHQQPQQGYPAYGYPQPVAATGPRNGDSGFTLPPQGPQFQSGR